MDSLKETITRDNLFGSEFPQMFDEVTIASGAKHVRGEVLGIITSGGKAKLLDESSSDGSENFDCVLTEDTDATGGDVVAPVAIAGSFQEQALTVGGSTVLADYKAAARALNCYIQTSASDNNVVGG